MKNALGVLISTFGLALALILSGCAARRTSPLIPPPPDSSVVDEKILHFFSRDPDLSRFDLKVNTFRGLVKLDGVVDTEEQRAQATKLSFAVPGVNGVENHIFLRSEKGR